MSIEILMNVTPRETRVALVENGVLQEVIIERESRRGLVGNIYKGKISRVLPGMQAAFVDVGLQRAAFLHASDIAVHPATLQDMEGEQRTLPIDELVREGQDVLVQVVKDPLGTKGARLTTHLTVPSRYLVFMSDADNIGVSQKIEDLEERQRLRDAILPLIEGEEGSYIIRTAAEDASVEDLREDVAFLRKLWGSICEKAKSVQVGQIVHEDLSLVFRTLRDVVDRNVEKMRIDSRETYRKLTKFADQFVPEIADRIEHYPGERPIFDIYGVEDEIHKALEKKVELKSGGYLIIDQTEAMTTIDVNTGAFVGHRNLEETIFKTNLEATHTIARQLRLRNLGGIIIIDFIDMTIEDHKRQVLRSLERALERDRAKTHISEVSSLGLVEMTRKRTRESLEHLLCDVCPTCDGRGAVKTAETVCYEIFREIMREERQYEAKQYMVLAAQEVVDMLLDEESTSVAELQSFIGKPIKMQAESMYSREQFDVVLM